MKIEKLAGRAPASKEQFLFCKTEYLKNPKLIIYSFNTSYGWWYESWRCDEQQSWSL